MFWFSEKESSFFEATRQEKLDTIERLVEQGTMRSGYYLLLILATLITVPGLFLDNVSVVIGGMILAPLMIPLLSLSLSLVTGSPRGLLRSLKILAASIVIAMLTAAAMTLMLKNFYGSINWIPQNIQPGVYIFIAFCSGVAGAFAWVKENLAPAIAGVATAVALLPPLCAAGIGLALIDSELLRNSLIIFTANLVGITVAAFLVFWILGFLNTGRAQRKIIDRLNGE